MSGNSIHSGAALAAVALTALSTVSAPARGDIIERTWPTADGSRTEGQPAYSGSAILSAFSTSGAATNEFDIVFRLQDLSALQPGDMLHVSAFTASSLALANPTNGNIFNFDVELNPAWFEIIGAGNGENVNARFSFTRSLANFGFNGIATLAFTPSRPEVITFPQGLVNDPFGLPNSIVNADGTQDLGAGFSWPIEVHAVPEPGMLALGAAAFGLGSFRRRREE